MSAERLDALRAALEISPDNNGLRLVLAEALEVAGEVGPALDHYDALLERGALPSDRMVAVGGLALAGGRLALAARCLDQARARGVVGGTAELESALKAALDSTGVMRRAVDVPEEPLVTRLVDPLGESVTFADVGGLDDVKKAIHRTIIMPFQRPDLYERYGRRAGGGVLLYGPPGCGKTMLARATAGECGLPFLNLRIEDVLDPMYGVSERTLHAAFLEARERAPCVLFIDELDAFAFARSKQQGSAGRALVDQLLQELDAIGSDNRGLLVLGATNAPWDVDDALKRPGRFDRVVFVPPPDVEARRAILQHALADRPLSDVDASALADATPMFSGADLTALVERAVDAVIDDALDSGEAVPIGQGHLDRACAELHATTADWLRTARNYVEFANDGGRYDDVRVFLEGSGGREARSRRGFGSRRG